MASEASPCSTDVQLLASRKRPGKLKVVPDGRQLVALFVYDLRPVVVQVLNRLHLWSELIGQDLAYSDSLSHTVGTIKYQPLDVEDHFADTVEVADIHGRKVKTSTPMVCFLQNFESIIHKSQLPVFDAGKLKRESHIF